MTRGIEFYNLLTGFRVIDVLKNRALKHQIAVLIFLLSVLNIYGQIDQTLLKDDHNHVHDHDVYDLSWKKDLTLLSAGLSFTLLGDYMLGKADAPDLNEIALLDKADLWSFERGATTNYSSSAETVSYVFLFGSATLPFVIYAFDKARGAELAIGYGRFKAGKHFPTDVLTGYIWVGSRYYYSTTT